MTIAKRGCRTNVNYFIQMYRLTCYFVIFVIGYRTKAPLPNCLGQEIYRSLSHFSHSLTLSFLSLSLLPFPFSPTLSLPLSLFFPIFKNRPFQGLAVYVYFVPPFIFFYTRAFRPFLSISFFFLSFFPCVSHFRHFSFFGSSFCTYRK